MKTPILLGFLLTFSSCVFAQLPNCDVWLFAYSVQNQNFSFTNGKNISNHPGYNNQPSFSEDGKQMLYSSERDSSQTDIYSYNLNTGKNTCVIHTSVGEYSPELNLGKHFYSAVVVEKDSTQRIWKYQAYQLEDVAGIVYQPLLPNVKNVAYSRWYNDSIVFLCLLPEPMNLFLANVNTQAISKCATNVGRSMAVYHEKNRDLFLYSQMKSDSTYEIDALDSSGKTVSDFKPIPFLKGSQDFTVDSNGNIFMATGTKLFIWTIGKSETWKEINDFGSQGLHSITRLAVSSDGKHFALVDNTK